MKSNKYNKFDKIYRKKINIEIKYILNKYWNQLKQNNIEIKLKLEEWKLDDFFLMKYIYINYKNYKNIYWEIIRMKLDKNSLMEYIYIN